MIVAPHFPQGHTNRLRDCRRALVVELNDVINKATEAGRSRDETVIALADLLDAEACDGTGLLQAMIGYLADAADDAA